MLTKQPDETFYSYMIRLASNKKDYGLTWVDIASLLNVVNGENFGESTYRKFYAAFSEGMKYERGESIGVKHRILSISDLHIPYQLPISTFQKYAGKIDILQLNGDIVDCSSISKFPKAYRSSPMDEILAARKYLISLIDLLKPKAVYIVYGNHDIRFESYLSKNLDSDLIELMPRTSLEIIFEDGFTHYDKETRAKTTYEPLKNIFEADFYFDDKWYCQIGDTIFCHPLAYKSGIMKTAEAAMLYFRNEGFSFTRLVLAHSHRIGFYVIGNTTIHEQGACCHTEKMHYADGRLTPSQKQGYIYLEQDNSGKTLKYEQKVLN